MFLLEGLPVCVCVCVGIMQCIGYTREQGEGPYSHFCRVDEFFEAACLVSLMFTAFHKKKSFWDLMFSADVTDCWRRLQLLGWSWEEVIDKRLHRVPSVIGVLGFFTGDTFSWSYPVTASLSWHLQSLRLTPGWVWFKGRVQWGPNSLCDIHKELIY